MRVKMIENCFGEKKNLYFFCKRFMADKAIPEMKIFDVYRRAAELAKKFDSASVYSLLSAEFKKGLRSCTPKA